MYRLRFVVSMLLLAFLSSGFLLGEDKKADKEPIFVKAQLPRYYKQLGLSDKQKKTVYTVRAKYAEKIQDLQRQIEALKEQEKTDLENVLTEAQMARLKEIRSGGSGKEKEVKERPTQAKEKPVAPKKD